MKAIKYVWYTCCWCAVSVVLANKLGVLDSAVEWSKEELVFAGARTVLEKHLSSPSSYVEIDRAVIWSGIDDNGDDAHIVQLSFDAKNVYGTPLRHCKYVSYSEDTGSVYWNETVAVVNCPASNSIIGEQVVEMLKTAAFGLEHPDDMPEIAALLAVESLMN